MHFSVSHYQYMLLPVVALKEIFSLILAVRFGEHFVLVALPEFLHVEVTEVHISVEGIPRVRHLLFAIIQYLYLND